MKIPFHAWIVCGFVGVSTSLMGQSPSPAKSNKAVEDWIAYRKREEEKERAFFASARANEVARMENVNFNEECVTASDPADRLLFEHEQHVNSFLSVASKLGLQRTLVTHMSNPRLATHGGVMHPEESWNENGHSYALLSLWGMIGDLDQPKPKAYLFRTSPMLHRQRQNAAEVKTELAMEEAALNRFESHALTLLRKGEKLVRWECKESMHAVGAIRAEAQCLRCHDNNKAGDLLGAFTYSYTKGTASPPNEQAKLILGLNEEGKTPLQIAKATGLLKDNKETTAFFAEASVEQVLLQHGVVTKKMLTDQALQRQQALKTDLGPVKKPQGTVSGE
ncbi:hypothetical protein [Prosthecobacter sp.]|uniref:hypothetical protein n=1 Tax=Prosthecobacter sp. TaxID=1965333 RepID=UPI003784F333